MRSGSDYEALAIFDFILVSAMQVAFLAKDNAKEILGYDLYSKTERDLFIFDTVTMLFQGTNNKEDTANET
ncbi:MAG: hypothetical protein K2L82_15935 [Lachnospiraceae bacterium]|nr:hypothetical protein [Lachnospiraceae bacterium]